MDSNDQGPALQEGERGESKGKRTQDATGHARNTRRSAPLPAPDDYPEAGTYFVALTGPGGDEWWVVHRWLRQTDQGFVHTVVDQNRNLRWLRWDDLREAWVRSAAQADGAPVPPVPLSGH